MNAERTEKCEMLKSELSQLALVLESNQVFAEPINPITGEYLIRFVQTAIWLVSYLIPKKSTIYSMDDKARNAFFKIPFRKSRKIILNHHGP